MKLTDAQLETIKQQLRERFALRACEACQGKSFALHSHVLFLPNEVGSGVPCAVLRCEQCGAARLHDLNVLGLAHYADQG